VPNGWLMSGFIMVAAILQCNCQILYWVFKADKTANE